MYLTIIMLTCLEHAWIKTFMRLPQNILQHSWRLLEWKNLLPTQRGYSKRRKQRINNGFTTTGLIRPHTTITIRRKWQTTLFLPSAWSLQMQERSRASRTSKKQKGWELLLTTLLSRTLKRSLILMRESSNISKLWRNLWRTSEITKLGKLISEMRAVGHAQAIAMTMTTTMLLNSTKTWISLCCSKVERSSTEI